MDYTYKYVVRFSYFTVKKGGGGSELSFWFSVLLHHGLFFVFSMMSEFSLDDPGFTPPVPPVPPSSSESSVETPVDGRRKCSSCPRRMSKKSADRHTICISCRGFDCDINNRCEECLECRRMTLLNTRNIASPSNQGSRLLKRRLLCLILL